jgi:hypothetical protein
MTTEKIQELLLKAKDVESAVKEARTVLGIHTDVLHNIKMDVVWERWSIGIGSVIVSKGCRYRVSDIILQDDSPEYISTHRPWVRGIVMPKCPGSATREFNLYGDWTLPEKKED